jgi:dienelactone hydrolase
MLVATAYRPEGPGPFPLVIISHGAPGQSANRGLMGRVTYARHAALLVERGLAVIVPMRRGYGATGGAWAEDFGRCLSPDYLGAGLEGAMDLEAVVRFAARDPSIDARRIVLIGESAGGWASVAAASRNPPGVVGVVTFAGGRGSSGPGRLCAANALVSAAMRYGATARIPSLWVWAENDSRFPVALAREMFAAYRRGGSDSELVVLPPVGNDGHHAFTAASGIALWTPSVERFLVKVGVLPPP